MKPITSRVKESCSPLKQTTSTKNRITNTDKVEDNGNLMNVKTDIYAEGSTGGSTPVPNAVGGGEAGEAYKNKMQSLLKSGATYSDLAKAGHGTEGGLKGMFPGYENNSSNTSTGGGHEYSPVLTESKGGDRIDTMSTFERRKDGIYGRNSKISKRQEKKSGAQNTRRSAKFYKQEAKNQGLSNKEAREVKRSIKKGNIEGNELVTKVINKANGGDADKTKKSVSVMEAEYSKSKWQGPISSAEKDFSYDNPAQAVAVSGVGQAQMGKNRKLSTSYEYRGKGNPLDVRQKGGENVKAPEGTENKKDYEDRMRSSLTGGSGSVLQMKESALKMIKGNSPFKMKGFGKKG